MLLFSDTGKDDVYTMDENDVMAMGLNIVIAGQTTTQSAVDVLVALLVNYPDIQERAYHDIQEAIGDRIPTCDDKPSLPFIEALVLEGLRYGTVSGLSQPHYNREDIWLDGYLIPKGTMIHANIWSLSHDTR